MEAAPVVLGQQGQAAVVGVGADAGDMLAYWTNDLFPLTLHQVINTSGAERQSVPFFYDPNNDAPVEVIPTVLREGEEPRYPPTTYLAHL